MKKPRRAINQEIFKIFLRDFSVQIKSVGFVLIIVAAVLLARLPIGDGTLTECVAVSGGAVHSYGSGAVRLNCELDGRIITIRLPVGTPYLEGKKVEVRQKNRLLTGSTYNFVGYIDT